MKLILRAFSFEYPFISRTKSYHKVISEFPLSFNSSLEVTEELDEFGETEEQRQGLARMYETYLHSLISGDMSSLDTLVEDNLIYRTNVALNNLKEKGFSINLRGSVENFQVYCLEKSFYQGAILPLRNLNFPSEYYIISDKKSKDFIIKHYQFKSLRNTLKSFDSFDELNLKELNRLDDLQKYKEKISDLLGLMNNYQILCINYDVAVKTNLKLVIKNSDGYIIAGKEDDIPEFHLMRVELCKILTFTSFYQFFDTKNKKFYDEKLKGYLNCYTLVDIDGIMKKNLMVPTYWGNN